MTDYVLLSGVLFVAYFVRGMTGFGSGLVAVPLLAHVYPLQIAVPVVMSLDFAASFILGNVGGRNTDWGEIRMLLPFGLIGALLGAFALLRSPANPVLMALGAFTLLFGLRNAFGIQPEGSVSRLWAVPAGLIGSSAGALFGTSAPPYIIYLTHRLRDKAAVRATFSWLFVIDGGVRLTLFVVAGLFVAKTTQLALLLGVVPMLLGLYTGNRVHIRVSRDAMLRVVGLILCVSGIALLARALS